MIQNARLLHESERDKYRTGSDRIGHTAYTAAERENGHFSRENGHFLEKTDTFLRENGHFFSTKNKQLYGYLIRDMSTFNSFHLSLFLCYRNRRLPLYSCHIYVCKLDGQLDATVCSHWQHSTMKQDPDIRKSFPNNHQSHR